MLLLISECPCILHCGNVLLIWFLGSVLFFLCRIFYSLCNKFCIFLISFLLDFVLIHVSKFFIFLYLLLPIATLAQMVACLPLVQQVWGSISGVVVNFHLKIFNLRARMGGDVHFLIARLYIRGLD